MSFVSFIIASCTTYTSVSPEFTGASKLVGQSTQAGAKLTETLIWTMTIRCNAEAGRVCGGEAPPNVTATVPNGYVHCRTDGRPLEGPTQIAASWWWLDGPKVRVYARACGGPFYDRYGSTVKAEWTTYMVPAGQEGDPANACRPEVKGYMYTALSCM